MVKVGHRTAATLLAIDAVILVRARFSQARYRLSGAEKNESSRLVGEILMNSIISYWKNSNRLWITIAVGQNVINNNQKFIEYSSESI